MKILLLLSVIVLSSCSQEPGDDTLSQWPQKNGVLGESQYPTKSGKQSSANPALKDYQNNIQRAKNMEKEVLDAAKTQRKVING